MPIAPATPIWLLLVSSPIWYRQSCIWLAHSLFLHRSRPLAWWSVWLPSLLFSRIIRLSRRAGQGLTDTTNALTAELTDVLNNIKPIKAMNRQEQITALFTRRINVIRGFIRRQETYHFGLERSTEAFITVAIGVGFYIATIHMNVALPELIVIGIFAIKGLETLRTLLSRLRFVGEYESAYFSTADFIADLMENQEQNTGEIVPELHTACRFEESRFLV